MRSTWQSCWGHWTPTAAQAEAPAPGRALDVESSSPDADRDVDLSVMYDYIQVCAGGLCLLGRSRGGRRRSSPTAQLQPDVQCFSYAIEDNLPPNCVIRCGMISRGQWQNRDFKERSCKAGAGPWKSACRRISLRQSAERLMRECDESYMVALNERINFDRRRPGDWAPLTREDILSSMCVTRRLPYVSRLQ